VSEQDWKARAEREAVAILNGVGIGTTAGLSWNELVSVMACGWLQGVNLGCHETLAAAEMAFERVQAEL
jgi:hypothetical protein